MCGESILIPFRNRWDLLLENNACTRALSITDHLRGECKTKSRKCCTTTHLCVSSCGCRHRDNVSGTNQLLVLHYLSGHQTKETDEDFLSAPQSAEQAGHVHKPHCQWLSDTAQYTDADVSGVLAAVEQTQHKVNLHFLFWLLKCDSGETKDVET